MESLENYEQERLEIADMLFNFPFNTSLAGFSMLSEAILLAVQSKPGRMNMTKDIYSHIAKTRNINENSVEKGIKCAIDSVSSSCVSVKEINCPNLILKNALINGRPKHFIMAVSEAVKLKILKRTTLN